MTIPRQTISAILGQLIKATHIYPYYYATALFHIHMDNEPLIPWTPKYESDRNDNALWQHYFRSVPGDPLIIHTLLRHYSDIRIMPLFCFALYLRVQNWYFYLFHHLTINLNNTTRINNSSIVMSICHTNTNLT